MKIAVCIKRVPDTETRIKIAADGKSIDESGVKFVLNPFDEYAVEEALKLKEQSNGEVVAICLGPEAAQETLRTALAMGVDRGILLKAERLPRDPLVVARALAAELEQGGYDLALFGKLAVDDYDQAVGTIVAELLALPSVSAVTRLEITDGHATAQREVEGAVELVEFSLPAVVTAEKGLNEPRYPALRGIMLAKKKPLDIKEVELDEGGIEVLELTLPPDRKSGRIVGEGAAAVPELVEALRNEAKVF
ncbi:MAG: electron transfer flavoprotein subunit beta/FixA family protein [Gemmatimonadota bacterium]|nr:MAG: electron transfer flavoprotein subunit beta/FixA family protein [Gemmatimonadota bacterium]